MTNSGLEPQPDEGSGDTNFNSKNQKMPTDGQLQAEEPGAGATLPELLDDENHVQSSVDGDTLDQHVSNYAKNVQTRATKTTLASASRWTLTRSSTCASSATSRSRSSCSSLRRTGGAWTT